MSSQQTVVNRRVLVAFKRSLKSIPFYSCCRDKLERGLYKKGIYVIQLQGHIFFGNIQQVSHAT